MIIRMIAGYSRICGKAQGYLGLPVRDVIVTDTVNGPGTAAMETAWEPTPDELAVLNAGGSVVVTILGTVPAPMRVWAALHAVEDGA